MRSRTFAPNDSSPRPFHSMPGVKNAFGDVVGLSKLSAAGTQFTQFNESDLQFFQRVALASAKRIIITNNGQFSIVGMDEMNEIILEATDFVHEIATKWGSPSPYDLRRLLDGKPAYESTKIAGDRDLTTAPSLSVGSSIVGQEIWDCADNSTCDFSQYLAHNLIYHAVQKNIATNRLDVVPGDSISFHKKKYRVSSSKIHYSKYGHQSGDSSYRWINELTLVPLKGLPSVRNTSPHSARIANCEVTHNYDSSSEKPNCCPTSLAKRRAVRHMRRVPNVGSFFWRSAKR